MGNTIAIVLLAIMGIMDSRTYAKQVERIDELQAEVQLLQGKVRALEAMRD